MYDLKMVSKYIKLNLVFFCQRNQLNQIADIEFPEDAKFMRGNCGNLKIRQRADFFGCFTLNQES